MSTAPKTYLTAADYLRIERAAEGKSEFYRGEMFAMAGASREHNLIVMNVGASLQTQLRNSDCEVYPSDMRVNVSPTGLYTYPDVSVACENPEFEDARGDTLLNPRVLVEVLSEATEAYDRGPKFEQYRQLASLRDYLLIAQDRVHVEHFELQSSGSWLLREYNALTDVVQLASLDCHTLLSDIYLKVDFLPREQS
jgi:Uma2 family endonuclease